MQNKKKNKKDIFSKESNGRVSCAKVILISCRQIRRKEDGWCDGGGGYKENSATTRIDRTRNQRETNFKRREGPHWHEPSVVVAQDSVDANCNHGCSRQIWCNGRERPILMSRKSEKSIHDTLLIEQKLNYQLRVVNFVCTRGFLYFTRRKTKILQRKNLTKVCVFFFFFFLIII